MTNKTDLREELLRQNGLSSDTLSSQDRQQLHDTIELNKKRVRRLKWIVAISWITVFLDNYVFIPVVISQRYNKDDSTYDVPFLTTISLREIVGIILAVSFIVAVVSTISLVVHNGFLRNRQMEDIRLSLRNLEKELQRTKQKEE